MAKRKNKGKIIHFIIQGEFHKIENVLLNIWNRIKKYNLNNEHKQTKTIPKQINIKNLKQNEQTKNWTKSLLCPIKYQTKMLDYSN